MAPIPKIELSKHLRLSRFQWIMLSAGLCSVLLGLGLGLRHKHDLYTQRVLSLPVMDEDSVDDEENLREEEEAPKPTKKDDPWRTVQTEAGDSLSSIFKRIGIPSRTLQKILQKNPYAKYFTRIKPHQRLRFLFNGKELQEFIFPISSTESLVTTAKSGQYQSKIDQLKLTEQNNYISVRVNGSLYGTAKRLAVPYKLIHQMTDIFNWELDFSKDVRSGDQFTIMYKAYYAENKMVRAGEIIAVTYQNRGKTLKGILHQASNGDKEYYSDQGVSLRKAFVRYPIKFSHISSTFSLSRMHPVLHYNRPHKGVDLAAHIGTPIHATGNGRIAHIGYQSGYGNMIKIAHSNQYSTVYGHMLKFQKGLSRGSLITRGQIIGYVGQSGLANGPHCHYEFQVRNQPRNPSTIDLPRASSIPPRELAAFKAKAQNMFAQLKLYETANTARALASSK